MKILQVSIYETSIELLSFDLIDSYLFWSSFLKRTVKLSVSLHIAVTLVTRAEKRREVLTA